MCVWELYGHTLTPIPEIRILQFIFRILFGHRSQTKSYPLKWSVPTKIYFRPFFSRPVSSYHHCCALCSIPYRMAMRGDDIRSIEILKTVQHKVYKSNSLWMHLFDAQMLHIRSHRNQNPNAPSHACIAIYSVHQFSVRFQLFQST